MPKLAATLASLLLIASSIGVNIARYPQVGRMIDPSPAEAAESASPAKATVASAAETARAEMPPATAETTTRPQTAQETAVGINSPYEGKSTEALPSTPAPQAEVAVPIIDVRPMVPVTSLQAGGDTMAGHSEVRRLPPVENNGTNGIEADGKSADAEMAYATTLTP